MTGRGGYILVVEDDLELSSLTEAILSFHGYDVATASNGREALDRIGDRPPRLILLDMRMPIMDGAHFADAYRCRHGKRTPIVVTTAAEDAQRAAAEVGADAVLAKPFEMDELIDTIARLLQRRAQPASRGPRS
mgnify:CR=1 FL=1